MEKLSVFDLDGTLVSYDSYRVYIREIFGASLSGRLCLPAWYLMRRAGLLAPGRVKEMIVRRSRKIPGYGEKASRLAAAVLRDFAGPADELLKKQRESGDRIVILSASPHDYVERIGRRLGCLGQGSYFDSEGRFVHLHGENKISWVQQRFPAERYDYNVAVSDCRSDLGLLELFRRGCLFDGVRLLETTKVAGTPGPAGRRFTQKLEGTV